MPQLTLRIPMVSRDPDEEHRASTPLELFFDLTFVVAIAQAAASLHHGLAEGHVARRARSGSRWCSSRSGGRG